MSENWRECWLTKPLVMWRLSFVVSRSDFWIGAYLDRDEKVLYIAPLPMLVFGFKLRGDQEAA